MKAARLLWLALALAGCSPSPTEQARNLMAGHSYAGALQAADQAPPSDIRAAEIRTTALLVEGRTVEGFGEFQRLKGLLGGDSLKASEPLMEATVVIARETDRWREVTAILDSSVGFDPGLRGQAVALAYQRGMEYLNSSGEAGYRLMNWAVLRDSGTMKKLRATDIILARRYEEMDAVAKYLPRIAVWGRRYFDLTGRLADSLAVLQRQFPEMKESPRQGWEIRIGAREGRIVAEAHAALDNPWGIKRGAVVAAAQQ